MKASELRIGNLIICKEQSLATDGVIRVNRDIIFNFDFFEFEPIPLTEEWLKKFGFDSNNCIYIGIDESSEKLQVTKFGNVLIYDKNDDFINLRDIKYIHELQNLYFVLTGKELVI